MRIVALSLLLTCLVAADPDAWAAKLAPPDDDWKRVAQELSYNCEGEPQTLDPGLVTGAAEGRLVLALFEGLTTPDPQTLESRPGLAARWEISADACTYTFHLRPGLVWSDGTALTADDLVRSWRRVLEPATGSEYANLLFLIRGGEDFHRGKLGWDQVGVAAPDAVTLVVRLHRPCPWFLELTSFPTLMPVPTALVAKHGPDWVRAGKLVGNGPFRLAAWEPRSRLVLERNPLWHGAARVRLQRLTGVPCDDAETAWRLYQQGAIQWTPALPVGRTDAAQRHPDYYLGPMLGTYYYRFNVTRPPFDDVRVRRAFCHATDRAAIVRHVTRSGELPATGFVPPMPGHDGATGRAYDPAAARRLLAEAGYGPQRPLPRIDLLYNTSANHKAIAEAAAAQWRRVLGADVRTRNMEFKSYLGALSMLDYAMARSSWIGDYNDPNTFLDIFRTGDGNNRTGWSDPAYDHLLDQSQAETDPLRRRALLTRLERILVEDGCPVIPVYTYVSKGLISERLRGWFANARDLHPFQYLWLAP